MALSLVLFFSQLKVHDLFSKPEMVMSVCPQRGGGGGAVIDLSVTPSTLTGHQAGLWNTPHIRKMAPSPDLFSSQLKAQNLFSEPEIIMRERRGGG